MKNLKLSLFCLLITFLQMCLFVKIGRSQNIQYDYKIKKIEHICTFCSDKYLTNDLISVNDIRFDNSLGSINQIGDAISYSITLEIWNVLATSINHETDCQSNLNKTFKHVYRDGENLIIPESKVLTLEKGLYCKNALEKVMKVDYIQESMIKALLTDVKSKVSKNPQFLHYNEISLKPEINIVTPGQEFKAFKIGENEIMVMAENLNVDKFQNGDLIAEAKSDEEWTRAWVNKQPVWCYYMNDPKNGIKYGKIYNRYAINDNRGLAPLGWKLLNDNDWDAMIDYFDGIGFAGAKLKSVSDWLSTDEGQNGNGNNLSGFNAKPGGYRCNGGFRYLGTSGIWWSSNGSSYKMTSDSKWCKPIREISDWDGFYVRCIKLTDQEQKEQDDKKNALKRKQEFNKKYNYVSNLIDNNKLDSAIIILQKMKIDYKDKEYFGEYVVEDLLGYIQFLENKVRILSKSISVTEEVVLGNWELECEIKATDEIVDLNIIARFDKKNRSINLEITTYDYNTIKSIAYGTTVISKSDKKASQINLINGVFEIVDNKLVILISSNEVKKSDFVHDKEKENVNKLLFEILNNLVVKSIKSKKIELENPSYNIKIKGLRID